MLKTSFAIKSNEDDEYLEKLLGYFSQIVGEIESTGGLKEPVQIAIMGALMLCDELYKEKTKNAVLENDSLSVQNDMVSAQKNAAEVERLTLDMIDRIDKVL